MVVILGKIKQRISQFRKDDEGGVSTLEFVILAPTLFFMFLAIFEAGWLMTRQMMLDRGVDMAMRDVRLNKLPNVTPAELRGHICEEALGITNCDDNLSLEMRTMAEAQALYPVTGDGSAYWPHTDVACQERGVPIDPVIDGTSFGVATPDVLMVVVACVMVEPLVPGLGNLVPGMTSIPQLNDAPTAGYKMTAFAAYKAEPGG